MQFQGLRSETELAEVMQAYDNPEIAQFPPGSGWSLTRFFWPTAWDAGHRLSHHCKHAWKAFADAAEPEKLFQIGAEYWSLAIEHVLTTTMNFHLPTNPVSAEIWPQAVEQSGLRIPWASPISRPDQAARRIHARSPVSFSRNRYAHEPVRPFGDLGQGLVRSVGRRIHACTEIRMGQRCLGARHALSVWDASAGLRQAHEFQHAPGRRHRQAKPGLAQFLLVILGGGLDTLAGE
jgi:hypothetical protein